MCSIIGSYSKERLKKLSELNAYRGTHSHSLFVFNSENEIVYSHRGFGALVIDDHPVSASSDYYFVAHQQAPTTDAKDVKAIHPAALDGALLWHNGIIKADDVKRLQELYESDEKWDTKLLLRDYIETGNLSAIDGTFACLMYCDYQLTVFRNEISPMFYNELSDISSTKFDNSTSVPANKVLTFIPDSIESKFILRKEFATKENPYFFA